MSSLDALMREYRAFQARGLKLDMTRGKPSPQQLVLSEPMLDLAETFSGDGTDCRNYGGLTGLPEARQLFGEILDVPAGTVVIGGNSSLALMHDLVVQGLVRGVWGGARRFICPAPGYDRHFAICRHYGIDMTPVEMLPDGPDMDAVESLAMDPSVIGMWCNPKYSNPTGVTFSDDVVRRLARMKTAHPNFRIFWDNAYAVHDLRPESCRLLPVYEECQANGTEDRVFTFGSTSKMTFAGAGIAAVAMSPRNLEWYLQALQVQTIGPDKLNQLRHLRFLPNIEAVERHMSKHATILAPKFAAVLSMLQSRAARIAEWSEPSGGYFVSLNVRPGCAKRVVELAGQAGVKLTPAGATYPYGKDPLDSNIRIAPSFPLVADVETAMDVVGLCVQIATEEKS